MVEREACDRDATNAADMNPLPIAVLIAAATLPISNLASSGPYVKAPALGIHIGTLSPGRYDAITDVAGVRVGQVTHIEGEGRLKPGIGPVRTGVTAVI